MVKHFIAGTVLLVCGFCLCVPQSVYALALAESNLSFSNLKITPRDAGGNPVGTVELQFDWGLEAFAEARNSLGELDQDFDPGVSPDTVIAGAEVTWVPHANGNARAPASPADLNVAGSADGQVLIPDHIKNAWAAADERGSLFNEFMITGGTGTVNVDFSMDLAGFLHVLTDDNGILAQTETIFGLELDGEVILFDWAKLNIGPDDEDTFSFSTTLSTTRTLEFDVPYFLYLEADSESFAVVPVPSPVALMLLGLGILGFVRKRCLNGRYFLVVASRN